MLDVGTEIISRTHVDLESEKADAVKVALQDAEEKHSQHLKVMLNRLKSLMNKEREEALEDLKQVRC